MLGYIRSIPSRIKSQIKLRRFKTNSIGCKDLTVCAKSNIIKDSDSTIEIGDNCDILGILLARNGSKIKVGDCTTIRYNSLIGCVNSIEIGKNVIISNNVHIYDNNNHPTDPDIREEMCKSGFYSPMWDWSLSESAPVVIEDNVWIGERATILKGVTIGKGSIVACDSVVTHCAPPYCVIAGNPAKVVKTLRKD